MRSQTKGTFRPGQLEVTLTTMDGRVTLDVTAPRLGTDRSDVAAWGFTDDARGRGLAGRLARCVRAGRAFAEYEVLRDVNGHTYIHADTVEFFHGRHMSASLRKLGF